MLTTRRPAAPELDERYADYVVDSPAREGRSGIDPSAIAALAILSTGAGFLHAAIIHGHEGHGMAPEVFALLAVAQIAWAGFVLARPSRRLLLAGAVGNLAVVIGYVLTRTSGIGFIDGFQQKEVVGRTDGITTALEVAIVGAAVVLALPKLSERLWPTRRLGAAGLATLGVAVALAAIPAGEAAATTPRLPAPPTTTGRPRSSGRSRSSTDTKKASMSRWRMDGAMAVPSA